MKRKQCIRYDFRKSFGALLLGLLMAGSLLAETLPGNTPVYYGGGKRGHINGCRRLSPEKKAAGPTMTLAEMEAKGGRLCSRCPGSELNKKREAKKLAKNSQYDPDPDNPRDKYGRKGAKARQRWMQYPAKDYAPNTPAVCDALWMRVHEVDCPELILKDLKKVITLAQADKEGWRIGETGQSGRNRCCFKGYRRQHPEKGFTKDSTGIVQTMKNGKFKWHQAGCHRFKVKPDHKVMTIKEAELAATAEKRGFYLCNHCIERGPSATSVDPLRLARMSTDGPAAVPYRDPLAVLEEFMGRRFFFDYSKDYKTYRSTGDKSALDSLRKSALYYHSLYRNYPSAAQAKASDPEHWNYLFPMAGWSRITLQVARKYPGQVSQQEIDEAEAFLNAIVATLKPVVEGDYNLDPEMGIPVGLANSYRSKAYNRAANGIGTLAVASKALEDLQAIKETSAYQPTIDRYRKSVEEWVKNWKKNGCLYTEADGKTYFYYPYNAGGHTRRENGLLLGGADDQGHYSHTAMGVTLIFESTPELGVDEDFMTAMANAITYNSTTEYGSIQTPSADRIEPKNRKEFNIPREKFYVYEAFRDGLIAAQNRLKGPEEAARITSSRNNLWNYFEALRNDRSLIHLGEVM